MATSKSLTAGPVMGTVTLYQIGIIILPLPLPTVLMDARFLHRIVFPRAMLVPLLMIVKNVT
jgi:hypothetical protein